MTDTEQAQVDAVAGIVAFFNEVAIAFGAVCDHVAATFDAFGQAWIQAAADRETGRNPYTALAAIEAVVVEDAHQRLDAIAARLRVDQERDDAETKRAHHAVLHFWGDIGEMRGPAS